MDTAAIALIVALIVTMLRPGNHMVPGTGLYCGGTIGPQPTFVVISQRIFANSNSFSMLAIPAFILAGDIMSKGGLSKLAGGICGLACRMDFRWDFAGFHRCLYIFCGHFRFFRCNNGGHRRSDVPGDV